MNWRRGLVFSVIHFLIAASLLIWVESKFWPYIRIERNRLAPAVQQIDPSKSDEYLSPCDEGAGWDGPIPPQDQIVMFANVPATIIAGGGHIPCTFGSPLDHAIEKRYGRIRKSEMIEIAIVCGAIAVQWFLIGAFPLSVGRLRWLEPGTLITASTPIFALVVFIPDVDRLSPVLPFFALLVWAYLLIVLTVKLVRIS